MGPRSYSPPPRGGQHHHASYTTIKAGYSTSGSTQNTTKEGYTIKAGYTINESTQNTIPIIPKRLHASKGGVHTLMEEKEIICTNVVFPVQIQAEQSK